MKKEWILKNTNAQEKSLIKRLLNSRGIFKEDEIKTFLSPLETEITSPYVFTDMEKATNKIAQAIKNQEHILIYGDFDADGVTSTSILYKTFKLLNANFSHFIPNRETEGHGLDTKALIKLITSVKPKLVITVDCGISNVKEIAFLKSFNIDTIITDHHEAPEELPSALAIINPKAPNALSENLNTKQIESLTYLAGCGVAFKLALALLTKYKKTDFVYELLPLVAVGTIADVVPLLGENRYFVTKGLELISKGKHEGLKRLIESAGYDITKGVTSEIIAFGVAPRINASGRLDTVENALKVLISDNPQEVGMAITTLNELNKIRQTLCAEVFEQADNMVQKEKNLNNAIVLANKDWHIGIIGIVASKLVEKYYKPVFLMNYNPQTQEYRCSARSIEGIPLYDVISENSELLEGFGGHALAAGLSFSETKTSFENVKNALNQTVSEYMTGRDLKPFINIDLKLQPDEITTDLVEEISKLEPFGASNPSPIFEIDNLTVKEKRLIGSDGSHLRLILNSGTSDFTALWWGKGDITLETGDKLDLAFHPQINEFNGNISIQLIIDDIHSDAILDDIPEQNSYKIYDNRTKTGILPNVNDYLKSTKLNVKVFAESKYILDTIKTYPQIASNTFTREDIPKCDVIMFFDYPADQKTFNNILEKAKPKGLHFMNYVIKEFDEQSLIKTFNGMIKYASHNNEGKIELVRCASFLGKSVEIIEMLLNLFEESGVIKIIDKNKSFYNIEYLNNFELSKILNNTKLTQIMDMSHECEIFQQMLLEEDLEQLIC